MAHLAKSYIDRSHEREARTLGGDDVKTLPDSRHLRRTGIHGNRRFAGRSGVGSFFFVRACGVSASASYHSVITEINMKYIDTHVRPRTCVFIYYETNGRTRSIRLLQVRRLSKSRFFVYLVFFFQQKLAILFFRERRRCVSFLSMIIKLSACSLVPPPNNRKSYRICWLRCSMKIRGCRGWQSPSRGAQRNRYDRNFRPGARSARRTDSESYRAVSLRHRLVEIARSYLMLS